MTSFPAVRAGDLIAHGGSILTGSPDVFINKLPAAFCGASAVCCGLHVSAQAVASGAPTVFINGLKAAHKASCSSCGSPAATASLDVFIGV
ncbi:MULTISPECIES: PAAR domain-containing protein [unclassified Achromobacter]|uniref:PAAR domain-containing protein n=1 Tax=unclassified Achromobacter TaxID=2626865 RepID=UPI0008B5930D|nr:MULTISPECIES: PAAR domain-containing protein [unclassified Achromobacter]SEJ77252.1 Zn-binding Pro-Ala-Ala-Arg (PAAR) domain-containing protein, incolved in TypeVI secretion [Achromobacter sp. NFACC18-2]SIT13505.1 Zn-binding Pro-Ala-Ala-Arg (PAAR) domain-containing protein, incolved in TypeVI secretion [Achromobacter sp. MFA1 R4]